MSPEWVDESVSAGARAYESGTRVRACRRVSQCQGGRRAQTVLTVDPTRVFEARVTGLWPASGHVASTACVRAGVCACAVLSARGLPALQNHGGSSDPYCVVKCDGCVAPRGRVAHNTQEPVWNAEFVVCVLPPSCLRPFRVLSTT